MAQGQHPLSTEALSQHLRQKGLAVEAFHAGLSESRRRELVEQLNSRELQALVVTSSFGMGMDLDWLEWVVHAQPPTSLADYLQGAGRAGRGMLPVFEQALCVVIGDESDRRDLSQQLYYHLPREETLRATLKGWLSSPHDEPEPGVYVDHDNQIITIDTRRQIAQGGAMRYAMRKGALEPLATASHELLRFRVRNSPEVWSNFYRERERDRETIDREWLRVMNLVTGRGCRRATVLSVFDDVPEPPYPGCCDVCDGPVVKDLNRCV
jgi:ATP-dependent DNA helicase RecQ